MYICNLNVSFLFTPLLCRNITHILKIYLIILLEVKNDLCFETRTYSYSDLYIWSL